MANVQKTFDEINKRIITNDKRFLTMLSENNKVIVLDFKSINYIELDTHHENIFVGSDIFIHYKNLNYNDSIEEFFAVLVEKWIDYKRSV